jgi:hypothetical protein
MDCLEQRRMLVLTYAVSTMQHTMQHEQTEQIFNKIFDGDAHAVTGRNTCSTLTGYALTK